MRPIAVYHRTIRASVPRIWENVLDWEHLPWLHASSFLDVALLTSDREGWRAWITASAAGEPRRSLVEVRLERGDSYYWTRTVEGFGAGSSIRTTLAPLGERSTDITVEFFVPGLASEAEPSAGRAYERLYARLWDEDEAMMIRRQEVLDAACTEPPIAEAIELGSLASVRARLPLVLGTGDRAVRLLEIGGAIVAHAAVCPHRGGPLERGELCDGVLTCPWHGYRFDLQSGDSVDGLPFRLPPAPRVDVDAAGVVVLVWP